MIKKVKVLTKESSCLRTRVAVSVTIVFIMTALLVPRSLSHEPSQRSIGEMGHEMKSNQVSQKPITSTIRVQHQIVKILDISNVGKVEADLTSNELVLTSYAPSYGGMFVWLFDGTISHGSGHYYVYGPKRVTLQPGLCYMVTISRHDKMGVAFFRIAEGRLALKVLE